MIGKPRVAIHKFSSCDGCQLAFLNAGAALLKLAGLVDIVHFAEAGYVAADAKVDIAFVEGSITTPDEAERIVRVRQQSAYLVTLGACATSGGIQALRNGVGVQAGWVGAVYARPEFIASLPDSTPIAAHVPVDAELWGCPVNAEQVFALLRDRLNGVAPRIKTDSVCLECKQKGQVCVAVAQGVSCMGPVTRGGCNALCPGMGRGCYGCFGPSAAANTRSLGEYWQQAGMPAAQVMQRFAHINSAAPAFRQAAGRMQETADE